MECPKCHENIKTIHVYFESRFLHDLMDKKKEGDVVLIDDRGRQFETEISEPTKYECPLCQESLKEYIGTDIEWR